jgi:hypothetical protein
MASDFHVANALIDFANDIRRNSQSENGPATLLAPEQADTRRQRLGQLAADAEGLASKPRDATYQGFERILKQVEELGAPPDREIIIAVASAFMQRPYISRAKVPTQ